jgi:hypothetical protein
LLTQAEADHLLAPYKAVLLTILHGALDDWHDTLTRQPTTTGGLTARTRASFVHDRAVARLAAALGDHPGLRLKKARGGLFVVIVHDRLVLKIKKLDKRLRSRNIATQQTLAFATQEPITGMDGVNSATNATAGYVLDALTADPVNFVIVCWDGGVRLWTVSLADEAATGRVVEIEATPADAAQARTRTKIAKQQGESETS